MTELVIDASAFAKLLLRSSDSGSIRALATSVEVMLAPDLLLPETANTLWKYVRWAGLPPEAAVARFEDAERYPLELVPSSELLPEALRIACELPHPLYDCLYLLLALHGGRTLATADGRLRDAAQRLGVRVEWVGAGTVTER